MNQWYVLYTKPNAEYQVATALQQRDIQTYLPEVEIAKTRQGNQQKPFFPCYLFVNLDLEVISLTSVQWTPGLRRVVTGDGCPLPVPEEIITLIRRQLDEIKASGGWPGHSFKPGDAVQITAGPFHDMLAIFEGPTTPAQRVHVLLTILGHASRLQIDVTDLKKAAPDAAVPLPKRPRRTRGRGRYINRAIPAWQG
ncbi:MAG: hypothetical protein KJ077_03520 [Anaerolineae bacterium]|nr:hypothetical protein [Anaerolineae bacterium]